MEHGAHSHDRGVVSTPAGGVTTGPAIKLTVEHAFGCQAPKIDPLLSFAASAGNREKDYADKLIYKIGRRVTIFDGETGQQEFFNNRPKNVVDILHFTINSTARYISMCELIRHERNGANDAVSQVSIYSLSTLSLLNTCHYSLPRPFICSAFGGDRDSKIIAALSEEPDRMLVTWYWDKEKIYKPAVSVNVAATLLRCAPFPTPMFTTSGPASMKCWCMAPDGNLKASNLLPPAKEVLDIYLDHIWLPTVASHYRMAILVDPDATNEINKNRKQSLYIMEGREVTSTSNTSSSSTAAVVPLLMELKQTIILRLDAWAKVEKIVPSNKAFVLVGAGGLVCIYERTDDKNDPFVEARRLALGNLHLIGATVYPSEESIVLLSKHGRLLTMHMDITMEQIKKSLFQESSTHGKHRNGGGGGSDSDSKSSLVKMDANQMISSTGQQGITDLTKGGYHTTTILSADIAQDRPLMLTIGADQSCRIWNYITGKCELVHSFTPDEPVACAFHPGGFSFLVSFKDRVRAYHLLMDKVKYAKEVTVKNVRCLKYSHGAHYFAAASGINVCVYEARFANNAQPLMTFPGHIMGVAKLAWATGDQILFSGGLDGNVYGWPIAAMDSGNNGSGGGSSSNTGRIEVISATNRSAAIVDLLVDSLSTVFRGGSNDTNSNNEAFLSLLENNEGNGKDNGSNSASNHHGNGLEAAMSYNRSWLIVSSADGHLRMPSWSLTSSNNPNNPSINPNPNNPSMSSNNITGTPSSNMIRSTGSSTAAAIFASVVPLLDHVPAIFGDGAITITAMCLSFDRSKLVIGTHAGSVRVYPWPPPSDVTLWPPGPMNNLLMSAGGGGGGGGTTSTHHHGSSVTGGNNMQQWSTRELALVQALQTHSALSVEVYTHSGPVVFITLTAKRNRIVSAAADGSIFVHRLVDERPRATAGSGGTAHHGSKAASSAAAAAAAVGEDEDTDGNTTVTNTENEVVLLALEDIEEHVNEVVELQKLLAETRAKNEFTARKLELEHTDALKRVSEAHDNALTKERDAFDKQRNLHERKVRELMQTIDSKDSDHQKIVSQLENQYEHRLADQIMRYDSLSEKMALLKAKCEALLEAEKNSFAKQLAQIKREHDANTKDLSNKNRRAIEDKLAGENSYREIITQQEEEYEDELRHLITAAEHELLSERELIANLRRAMSDKQTQYDHLRKKFEELLKTSQARMELWEREVKERKRLEDTIVHYKKNLLEREEALAEKEKLVIELRSKTRTLENFRFVLDHRLQQLSSERGPITSHIEGLEKHIATMYEEWVDEFALKKSTAEAMQLQQQKAGWLSQDLAKLRAAGREKDASLTAFKRELGNIVSAMLVGKELEEAVRALYKKFVRGEHTTGHDSSTSIAHEKGGNGTSGVKVSSKAAEVINELVHGHHNGRANNTSNHHGHPVDNLNNALDDQSFLSVDNTLGGGHYNHHGATTPHGGGGAVKGGGGGGALHNTHNTTTATTAAVAGSHAATASNAQAQAQHNHASLVREVDEALIETAKEAERQKRFVERQSRNLKHRLQVTEREAHSSARHRLHENSDLLFECNDLRVENKELQRKIGLLKHDLETVHRAMHELKMNTGNHTNNTQNSSYDNHHQQVTNADNDLTEEDLNALQQQQAQLAPWVVHDMLPGTHQTLGGNNTEQQQTQLAGANSAPNLIGIGRTVPVHTSGGNTGNGQQSMPALPPNPSKRGVAGAMATVAVAAATTKASGNNNNLKRGTSHSSSVMSLSLPRATFIGAASAVGESLAEKRAERMAAAVEDLAQQLDEAQREREMQRIELARLRKQLLLTQSQQQSLTGIQQLPSLQQNSAGSTASLLMVSNNHGGGNINLGAGHGSLSRGQSGNLYRANATLTSADITGRPNDVDKASLRLGPASQQLSITSKGSNKSGPNSAGNSKPNSRGNNKIGRVGSGHKGIVGDAEREELHDTFSLHSAIDKEGSLIGGGGQTFNEE